MAQTEQQQATSGTRAAHQDPASSDHHRNQHQHLSIDISASESLLLAPTVPPAAAAAAASSSSSSSRGTSALTKPQRSPSFMLRQTVKSLLPGGSFKSSVRSIIARTSSLPVVSHVVSGTRDDSALSQHKLTPTSPASTALDKEGRIHSYMHRSQSLPMNMKKFNATKSFKRMNSLGGVYRVVPSISTPPTVQETSSHVIPDILLPTESDSDDAGEDIAEEEAVCRICMVELSEGSDTLKLECSCKGELALAHRGCAFKWFSIKGTRTCEVCKDEVQNLPVTLVRVQSMQQPDTTRLTNAHINTSRYYRYRTWRGTPILVIISILAYFCFLEQLLVVQDGIAALAISLPFSCILGLFSSLTTTSMVARRYVWIYATIQFLFVVFFTHLFYRYLHLQAVISIILATFAGFGVGMTGNSIIVEIIRWRAGRLPPPAQTRHRARRSRPAAQPPPQQQQEEQRDAGVDVENPTVPQPQA